MDIRNKSLWCSSSLSYISRNKNICNTQYMKATFCYVHGIKVKNKYLNSRGSATCEYMRNLICFGKCFPRFS